MAAEPSSSLTTRLRHPLALILLVGGLLGSGANLLVTLGLVRLGLDPCAAFFVGTTANQALHFVYYGILYVNEERRLQPPWVRVIVVLVVAALASWLLGALLARGLPLGPALGCSLIALVIGSAAIHRASTFASPTLALLEYQSVDESFYDDQTDPAKVSRFRAWYHRSRFLALQRLVEQSLRPGGTVADLGCGNCWWNLGGLPVVGVDVNGAMLGWAREHGRLTSYTVCERLSETGLGTAGFDVVIMSEVLEHVLDHEAILAEVKRLMKDDGTFVVTVPYDFFFSPFFLLFNLNCLYLGYVKGSRYHRYRCGHIHHFTRSRLRRLLEDNGFEVESTTIVNGLLVYATARKRIEGRI